MKIITRRLGDWVSRLPKTILLWAFLFVVAMTWSASSVGMEMDYLATFNPANEDSDLSEDVSLTFETNSESLISVIRVLDSVPVDERAIAAVAALTEAALNSPGIVDAGSVTNTGIVRPPGVGDPNNVFAPAFAPDTESISIIERINLARAGRLGSRQLISSDGRVFLVVALLDPSLAQFEDQIGPSQEFRENLSAAAEDHTDVVTITFAGLGFTTMESVEKSSADMALLSPVALLAMIALTWVFFRSGWAIVGTIGAMIASTVSTIGVMSLANDNINQFTSGLPVLLIGVTVATSTHIIHRYYLNRCDGQDSKQAGASTVEQISGVSFLCAATNAVGFLSLMLASIPVLREFGIYLAVGVAFCFIFTASILPATLRLADAKPPKHYWHLAATEAGHQNKTGIGAAIDRGVGVYARFLTAAPVAILMSLIGLAALTYSYQISRDAGFDFSLKKEFPADTELGAANNLIDTKLEGSVPFEISLKGEPGTWSNPENLQKLSQFDTWLRVEKDLWTLGIPSLLAEAEFQGIPPPQTEAEFKTLLSVLNSGLDAPQELLRQAVTEDFSWARLSAFTPENGAAQYLEMADAVEAEGKRIFADSGVEIRVTGEAAVSFRGISDLTGELVSALSVAVAMILGAIAIGLRSIRVAAVAFLPNAIPLAVGFAGYIAVYKTVDPLVAGVFAVVLGITADDTVHLAKRYLVLTKEEGVEPVKAVPQALVDLWRAMITSTAVMVSAFVVLMISSFPATRLVGLVGGSLLLLALLSDLVFGVAGIAILAALDQRKYNKSRRHQTQPPADDWAYRSFHDGAPMPETTKSVLVGQAGGQDSYRRMP